MNGRQSLTWGATGYSRDTMGSDRQHTEQPSSSYIRIINVGTGELMYPVASDVSADHWTDLENSIASNSTTSLASTTELLPDTGGHNGYQSIDSAINLDNKHSVNGDIAADTIKSHQFRSTSTELLYSSAPVEISRKHRILVVPRQEELVVRPPPEDDHPRQCCCCCCCIIL